MVREVQRCLRSGTRSRRPSALSLRGRLRNRTLDIAGTVSTLGIMNLEPGDFPSTLPPLPGTAEELLPLVYEELRRLAQHKMVMELPGQTLQPTALVHEA